MRYAEWERGFPDLVRRHHCVDLPGVAGRRIAVRGMYRGEAGQAIKAQDGPQTRDRAPKRP